MKKFLCIMLALIMAFTVCACGGASTGDRVVTDLVGREVGMSEEPQNIAAMAGPTYEMTFMLDSVDKIKMVKAGHTTNYPLALLTNPDLANMNTLAANPSSSVNIEDYLAEEIDLVLYYETETELEKFENAGIPAIVISKNTGLLGTMEEVKAQTIDEYIELMTSPIMILSDAINTEEAKAEAEAWKKYTAGILQMVYDRTKDLTDDQRKTVYWGNTWGENILASYSVNNRWYEVNLAGGKLLGPEEGGGNFPEITSEQLFKWDPDVILVDNHGNYPELVIQSMYKDGSQWASLSAVKNEELHRIPAGVFFLDKGSTTALMVLWMATVIQPELFTDVSVAEEIQHYYSEFYEYELTLDEAQQVVDGWYDFSTFDE
ncbi:MAG: ABC transporter substrate-binding protein [Firmicutes bacterium]|nr:ABC transporter substrate-binding protein [Bacillota bacterium]